MKAELIPGDGGDPIPISRDVTVLGRRDFCDIQIDHPSLSKRHCVIVKTDGLLVIRDLATTNGTKVKGQKIRWAALLPGDKIALGSIKFQVYLGPDNVPSPSEIANGVPASAFPPKVAVPTRGFVPPTPYPGVASPVRPSAPPPGRTVPATVPVPRPAAHPAFEDEDDEEFAPLPLADDGAWGGVMGPDSAEIPEAIDFD
jgi:predicted component of type VI protein secretion system